MGDDGGGAGVVGGIMVVGLVYWFCVALATAFVVSLLGLAVIGAAVVLYVWMSGVAFFHGATSGDWSVVRDSILAPALGVVVGILSREAAGSGILSLFMVPKHLSEAAGGAQGWIALLTLLAYFVVAFGILAFLVAGLGFGFIVTSTSPAVRLIGYLACIVYGLTYAGIYNLIETDKIASLA